MSGSTCVTHLRQTVLSVPDCTSRRDTAVKADSSDSVMTAIRLWGTAARALVLSRSVEVGTFDLGNPCPPVKTGTKPRRDIREQKSQTVLPATNIKLARVVACTLHY